MVTLLRILDSAAIQAELTRLRLANKEREKIHNQKLKGKVTSQRHRD